MPLDLTFGWWWADPAAGFVIVYYAIREAIELTVRALVGHASGEVHEGAHLKPEMLNARAGGAAYSRWLAQHETAVRESREDYAEHHYAKHGGALPVWAAVELLDWADSPASSDSLREARRTRSLRPPG